MNDSRPIANRGGLLPVFACGGALLLLCFLPARAAIDEEPSTRLVSAGSTGIQAGGTSAYPAVSANGRFVAFTSDASNLAAGDTNGATDVFVKDVSNGAIVCASVSMSGAPAQGNSYAASISGDGTRVAFASEGTDLVTGDQNGLPDVFVRNLAAGTTTRISVALAGSEPDGPSVAPRISADGNFVAFASCATNLVAGDTNGASDVFVRDLQGSTLERVSVSATGEPADGASEGAAISADGRFVVFASNARNLIAGENGANDAQSWDVYRRDRQTGTTVRASVGSSGGKGNGLSFAAAVSADGRFVAFASMATNLISSDLNGKADIFVRDLTAGATTRVSVAVGGYEANDECLRPSISSDGRFVTFESSATNLVPGFTPAGSTWSYVRDTANGTTARVVAASPEPLADGGTLSPAISADGHWIAFSSAEPDLVAGDTNALEDVFVRGPLQ